VRKVQAQNTGASKKVCGNNQEGFAEGWNRTSDTSIFSAVLYRLSYLGTAFTRVAEPRS
jgi:hypothetical protein